MDSMILVAFAVGLLSALHCVGMCGGIMAALSVALPESTRTQPADLTAVKSCVVRNAER